MRVGATPKCQAVHSGAGAQTCSGRGVRKAERRRAAGRRKGPEAVTEQETEWNRGDSHLSAISLLPGHALQRLTRSNFLARPRDKEPYFTPGIARLPFGAVILMSTQKGRDFAFHTMPRKTIHSPASNSGFHSSTHAAATEVAR